MTSEKLASTAYCLLCDDAPLGKIAEETTKFRNDLLNAATGGTPLTQPEKDLIPTVAQMPLLNCPLKQLRALAKALHAPFVVGTTSDNEGILWDRILTEVDLRLSRH